MDFLRKRKYLDEELSKYHIKIKWLDFPSGPPVIEVINSNTLDFAYLGSPPPIFAQVTDSQFVYIGHENPAPEVEGKLVHQDSVIKTIQDLKGKKIAFPRGSSAHHTLLLVLEKAGIKFAEITPVYLHPSDARMAFENKSVDAWVAWELLYFSTIKQLDAKILIDDKGLKDNITYYIARKEFAEKYPELIKIIVVNIIKIDTEIQQKPQELAEFIVQQSNFDADVITHNIIKRNYSFGYMDKKSVEEQQIIADSFYSKGLINKRINIEDNVWHPPYDIEKKE